jgi:hypothetical protein
LAAGQSEPATAAMMTRADRTKRLMQILSEFEIAA